MVFGIFNELVDDVVAQQEYFIDSQAAALLHKGREKQPRFKNQFFARFVMDTHTGSNISKMDHMLQRTQGHGMNPTPFQEETDAALFSRISNVTGPSVTVATEKINQYNRKRIYVRDYEYGDLTLQLRDTVDAIAIKFWVNYYHYFFRQAEVKYQTDPNFNDDTLLQNLFTEYGVDLRHKGSRQNFFKRLELYVLGGGRFTRIDLLNPYIVAFQHSDVGAEDITVGMHSMTVAYENLQYIATEAQILNSNGQIHADLVNILKPSWHGRLPHRSNIPRDHLTIEDIVEDIERIKDNPVEGAIDFVRNRIFDEDTRNEFDRARLGIETAVENPLDTVKHLGSVYGNDLFGTVFNGKTIF